MPMHTIYKRTANYITYVAMYINTETSLQRWRNWGQTRAINSQPTLRKVPNMWLETVVVGK